MLSKNECRSTFDVYSTFSNSLPSGNDWNSYWKEPFAVMISIKKWWIFPYSYVKKRLRGYSNHIIHKLIHHNSPSTSISISAWYYPKQPGHQSILGAAKQPWRLRDGHAPVSTSPSAFVAPRSGTAAVLRAQPMCPAGHGNQNGELWGRKLCLEDMYICIFICLFIYHHKYHQYHQKNMMIWYNQPIGGPTIYLPSDKRLHSYWNSPF